MDIPSHRPAHGVDLRNAFRCQPELQLRGGRPSRSCNSEEGGLQFQGVRLGRSCNPEETQLGGIVTFPDRPRIF